MATKWVASLASAGIRARRGTGQDFYAWLLKWFNPRPEIAGGDPDQLLDIAPYPGDEHLPFGHDLAETLTLSMPRSDNASATWWFDDLPHSVVTIQGLRRAPEVGHMTAERQAGDHVFSLFDRFPEHTVMVLTLTARPQDFTRNHIAQVKRAAVGDSAEAELTRVDDARGRRLRPALLRVELHRRPQERRRARVEEAAAAHGISVEVSLEVDSVATIRELVEAGIGCTALPFGAVRDGVEVGRLAAARISRPRISRTLHLGFRPSGPPSAAGQAIHRVIQDIAAERIKAAGGYWRAAEG